MLFTLNHENLIPQISSVLQKIQMDLDFRVNFGRKTIQLPYNNTIMIQKKSKIVLVGDGMGCVRGGGEGGVLLNISI